VYYIIPFGKELQTGKKKKNKIKTKKKSIKQKENKISWN